MLSRIIYSSRSLCSPSEAMALLDHARVTNARRDITGALYLADGRFLQCLEGEEEVLAPLLERIQRDPRHADCQVLDRRPISRRVYTGWSMAWLPPSPSAALMMKTIVAQALPQGGPDARAVGAFFYAMAQMGESE
ncbi:BLUF domain-containing protein (plasmid) [Comamonadaceae bacterium OTU4NAUVB1]|jgi:hypothetical protein|nr:BLUF domain-containing protein [Comamonadaceae bacterium OTU4NAUVB1]HSU24216.1 BLUF domain-containing protein [Variovorax sp.]